MASVLYARMLYFAVLDRVCFQQMFDVPLGCNWIRDSRAEDNVTSGAKKFGFGIDTQFRNFNIFRRDPASSWAYIFCVGFVIIVRWRDDSAFSFVLVRSAFE